MVIQSKRCWPTTLMPHNCFDAPPSDFSGHGTIELLRQTPFGEGPLADNAQVFAWAMLSGGNWDSKSPSCGAPVCKGLAAKSRWLFPYAIPNFSNLDHAGDDQYDTGVSIQNFSNFPVTITINYVIAQSYGELGQNYSFAKTLPANGGARFSLMQELVKVGYLWTDNSEGYVEMTSDQPAMLYPHLIPTTWNYMWRASEAAAE
jgi:hypothetical protein